MQKLSLLLIFVVILANSAAAGMLVTFDVKDNSPVAIREIQGISTDAASADGLYSYELVDGGGEIMASGRFSIQDAIFYDTFKKGALTGGYLKLQKFEVAVIMPFYPNIKFIRIIKDSKTILEEDISNNQGYINAAANGALDLPSNCTTIQYNGDPSQKLDITFISHGYTEAQRQMFISHVTETKDFMQSIVPFNTNVERINVHYVNQSFDLGCYSGCSGNPNLICCSEARVWAAAAQCPWTWGTDKIIVLTNGLPYGGSSAPGGNQAIASNAQYMREVAAHEFGHAFGVLWDEYDYGYAGPAQPGAYIPNCDIQPCSRWSNIPGTSCIPVCGYTNHYRSVPDSLMRSIPQTDYGVVSIRNMTQRLARFNAAPRITSTPVSVAYRGQSYTYQMTATDPNNDPLTFTFISNPLTMRINQSSGLITWNPVLSESRAPTFNVTVTDGRGGSASQYFLIRLL